MVSEAPSAASNLGRRRPSVSIIVPVYNGERTLSELCERIASVLHECRRSFEILIVDDCSRDASWERTCEIVERMDRVRGFQLMRNFGQHNAVLCGIREASYSVIVTLDDDLQNPPEEIPVLLEALTPGLDVVYGRPLGEQHGFLRKCASVITKQVLKSAMGVDVARNISAFRAFRTHLRDAFADYRGHLVSIDVLLTWATTRFAAVPVKHEPRKAGQSNYTMRKLITHALNMMTGFSTLPLQIASITGFAATSFGILVLIYVIGRVLIQGIAVPGFAFLVCVIAIFGGAQLFSIGIIGEYLGRMHFRTMDQPSYVLHKQVGPSSNQDEAEH
ncbi:MAG: glycosyltransferase family 2 protein [Phycisphaerales bacterium]